MAWKISPVAIAGVSIAVLLLMYRSTRLDLVCNESIGGDRWRVESSSGANNVENNKGSSASGVASKSVSKFLKEKADKGVFDNQKLQKNELAGMDVSTRELLSKVVMDSVTHPNSPGTVDQEKMFDLNYGIISVIRRLVVCSSYRTSVKTFSMITLSPEFTVATSNPDYKDIPTPNPSVYPTCIWLEDGAAKAPLFPSTEAMNRTGRPSVHTGEAVFRWMDEVHGTNYDTVMIHCTFPEAVGNPSGGYLYMNISHGPVGKGLPSELVPVFHEKPNQLDASTYEQKTFKFEYAYCACPSFTTPPAAHVKEFLMYNYVLLEGKVHFFIYYASDVGEETRAVLQPLMDAGLVTLVDFSNVNNYNIMYHGQAPAINDCLYRSKFLARWSLFWDLDEYLFFLPSSNHTLQSFLKQNKNAPWISFGKVDYRLSHCRAKSNTTTEPDNGWAVERMVYRLEKPFCFDHCGGERCAEMCPAEKGMRKWITNPRKVRSAVTHSISDPRDLPGGVVVNTNVARFNHYRGVVSPRATKQCQEFRDPEVDKSTKDTDGWTTLILDDEFAKFVTSEIKGKAEPLKIFGGTQ